MNLPTIEMPRVEAIKAFQEYRGAVRARHSAEDAQLMAGYRALASGHRLIDLRRTMQEAGVAPVMLATPTGSRELMLPRLAICRADAKVVHCDRRWDGSVIFNADAPRQPRVRHGVTAYSVVFGPDTLPRAQNPSAEAIVPLVPPQFRPARGLGGLHVLWEAEWRRSAPVDPALLRHLGGDLWAVLAIWDLTPLEQAVLMGRVR